MFAILKEKAGLGLTHKDVNQPETPPKGWVQVKVSHAGVCGTDMHIYQWDAWSKARVKPPRIIGHEFVGEIVAVGEGVKKLKEGARVSAECHITCGTCALCEDDKAHLCEQTRIIGVDCDGAFAEYVNVPAANVWPIPDNVQSLHAAIFDPLGNAMHAVDEGNVKNRSVCVVGAGAIGLMAVAMAKQAGARHISVIEPNPKKRELARKLGADIAVIPEDHANERIIKALDGQHPRIVLEMSGNEGAITNALALIQRGGTFVQLGIPKGPIQLDMAEHVVFKGVNLKGVTGRKMFQTWKQVEAFAQKNPEAIDAIISHVLPAQNYAKAFDLLEKGEANKIVLEF